MKSADSDALIFLRQYHADQPGMSPRTFAAGRCANGQNSYSQLLDGWDPATERLRILDLACGDGFLLELIRRRYHCAIELVGIDLSAAELAAARARLGQGVELLLRAAQKLGLPPGSIDHVVCHMALMLMAPVEPVLAEVAAVLKPGGSFTAIVNDLKVESPALIAFSRLCRRFSDRDGLPPLAIGDPRLRSAAGIREVFAAMGGRFAPPELTAMSLDLGGRVDGVLDVLMGFYPPWRLKAASRVAFVEELRAGLAALADPGGHVALDLPLLKIRARTRSPGN